MWRPDLAVIVIGATIFVCAAINSFYLWQWMDSVAAFWGMFFSPLTGTLGVLIALMLGKPLPAFVFLGGCFVALCTQLVPNRK